MVNNSPIVYGKNNMHSKHIFYNMIYSFSFPIFFWIICNSQVQLNGKR